MISTTGTKVKYRRIVCRVLIECIGNDNIRKTVSSVEKCFLRFPNLPLIVAAIDSVYIKISAVRIKRRLESVVKGVLCECTKTGHRQE